jgi:hypothetical protein
MIKVNVVDEILRINVSEETIAINLQTISFPYHIDNELSNISTNPVQNKIITAELDKKIETETDPIFCAHAAYGITSQKITNWDTAFSWGNHYGLYDPINTASEAIYNHETSYDHSLIATAIQTETDPIYNADKSSIVFDGDNISKLVNDSGYITSYTETDPIFSAWDKSTGISIIENQISDLQSYLLAGDNISVLTNDSGYITGITGLDVTTALGYTPENIANKGSNNGYASLDIGGKVPVSELPSTIMVYEGTWNADTNTPTLSDSVPPEHGSGTIYVCTVAGTCDLGSGAITFAIGDWVIYNGSIWQKSINSSAVVSVDGQQGIVVLSGIYQAINTNLTSLSSLDYVSTSFVKMTSAGTFELDTNIYITTETDPLSLHIDGETRNVTNGTFDLTTTGIISAGSMDWTGGNVVYVPLTGDINTYITAASAGDTLVLVAGTYTITSGIVVNKKLHIQGQGEGITTVTCSTDNVNMFIMSVSGSMLSDMTIAKSGAMTTTLKYIVLVSDSCNLYNLEILNTCTGGDVTSIGIGTVTAGLTINIENVRFYGTGAIGKHYFIFMSTNSSIINMYNCYGYENNGTSATGGDILIALSSGITNIYNSSFNSVSNNGRAPISMGGSEASANAYNCVFNGSGATSYDVRQSSGTLTLYDCTLVNNKTSGTITYGGTIVTNKLKTANIHPSADSTTAIQICKADAATSILNIDTSNARVGIGTTAPDRQLEINTGAATGGLRLTYNDANGSAATYADFLIDSNGDLAITATGGDISFGDEEVLVGNKIKFTQVDGNEYIDSLNDGYMDYRATTAHRFGDGTNQAVISSDGEITFEGTAKRKLTIRPNLIETSAKAGGTPTQIYRGVNVGYSMPIWSDPVNLDEQLFFRMRVPFRWDGTTDPQFGIMCTIQSAEDVGDKFKFELSWQTTTCHGSTVMGTTDSDCYTEQTIITGGGTQYTAYCVFFNLDASDATNPITAGNMLQGRVRRVSASENEIDGEVGIWDWVTSWAVDKVGSDWAIEENVT